MEPRTRLVVLFDVDNTLLDNDRFADDLNERLKADFGLAERERYWALYETLRAELGFADYLGALQRFRSGLEEHPKLLDMSAFLLDYPYAEHLYPQALQVLHELAPRATTGILSDGDIVFQPRKIHRAGLWDAVAGRVLIEVHKEQMLDAVRRRFPAQHYVMVDDKPQLLARMKTVMRAQLTTIWVQQGHYAARVASGLDPSPEPAPDARVAAIGDLLSMNWEDFQ